mmetsp:Transcript_10562/g.19136  ORF Transcript_10562/g.19136 Transcript_10562/m.19136 type:complete len:222 (+) Transcript_10562:483-1148(+)
MSASYAKPTSVTNRYSASSCLKIVEKWLLRKKTASSFGRRLRCSANTPASVSWLAEESRNACTKATSHSLVFLASSSAPVALLGPLSLDSFAPVGCASAGSISALDAEDKGESLPPLPPCISAPSAALTGERGSSVCLYAANHACLPSALLRTHPIICDTTLETTLSSSSTSSTLLTPADVPSSVRSPSACTCGRVGAGRGEDGAAAAVGEGTPQLPDSNR